MAVIRIKALDEAGVEVFGTLTEAQLRNMLEPDKGIFIAESPKVIHVALDAGCEPLSLLCEEKHITGDAASLIQRCGDIPVYTGDRDLLASLTGYTLTRGVLCAMRRPKPRTVEDVCRDATRIVVIDGVVDTTNIGAIFRSAAALGIDAVLLTPSSCDPLNRRAVRVSMGSVFLVPWTWLHEPICSLGDLGFKTAAMALSDDSISLDDPLLTTIPRLAHSDGHRGRRFVASSDSEHRLCGENPDEPPSGLPECGSRLGSSILAVARQEVTRRRVNKSTSQQVNESTSQQVNELTSQRVNESTSFRGRRRCRLNFFNFLTP